MKMAFMVAAGGALGAVARYFVMVAAGQVLGMAYPWGTLAVNLIGSFTLGVLAEGLALAWTLDEGVRAFLVVGLLGAFTTFSTFSLDVVTLYERGQLALAAVYVMASVILSLLALFAGLAVMRVTLA